MTTVGEKPPALITGASGGIGLELARVFARHGHELVLVARNGERLEEEKLNLTRQFGVVVRTIQQDLSHSSAPAHIKDRLQAEGVEIGILVNNAGFGAFGLFNDLEWRTEFEMMQVNIVGLTHLTKLFLKDMLDRREGKILNVASTAAFLPGPLMAVYYASKAYVLHFSEAIANELKGTGVSVSVLCPGPTGTGFQKRAVMEDSRLASGRKIMSARKVAERGYKGLMARKTIIIPGWGNTLVAEAHRVSPRSLLAVITRMVQERKT